MSNLCIRSILRLLNSIINNLYLCAEEIDAAPILDYGELNEAPEEP